MHKAELLLLNHSLEMCSIGCPIIIWTGLNIKIGIAQKVYELWNCSFAKMIVLQSLTKAIIFELFYYINGYFRV